MNINTKKLSPKHVYNSVNKSSNRIKIQKGGVSMSKIILSLMPMILVVVGLIVIDVAFYFLALIAGLVITGISLIIMGFLVGLAINGVEASIGKK